MFLKDIRDTILTIPFIALSTSMKSSLSEFFFSSWILRSFFFSFFAINSFIAVEKVDLFTALIESSLKHVTERVTKRTTTILSSFAALSEKKSQWKITLFPTFAFVYPAP